MTEMTFGETVKAERVKRGWSQQVLANRAGMNRSHIGGIELKPNPGRANQITKTCDWCSASVTRAASNFHSERVFCDYDCMAAWQSANVSGDAHPRWKGGAPRSYGIGWKAARRAVLKRSGGVCERCKNSPGVHVHHRLPARYFERIEGAHFIDNLLHVCTACHAAEHRELRRSMPLLDLIESKR